VATGQLSVGWSNDYIDRHRDRAVGRLDKPLVAGDVSERTVRLACTLAVLATVVLSLACGLVAGAVHLVGVAAGWSYNLGLKATALSWLPYAVGFGTLPVFAVLADPGASMPPPWVPLAGALLGVGAHLVNVLPDLDDDAATGVRGLPHRLGATVARVAAVVVLVLASLVIVTGADDVPGTVVVAGLAAVTVLAVVAMRGTGRLPFQAAIGIAIVDVVLLVVAG
jgi:4-hydroxybenzoate polyprenyltransferase